MHGRRFQVGEVERHGHMLPPIAAVSPCSAVYARYWQIPMNANRQTRRVLVPQFAETDSIWVVTEALHYRAHDASAMSRIGPKANSSVAPGRVTFSYMHSA